MKSFLSLQKFQEDDTQVWAINCTKRKEPLFSRKIHSGARNRLSPVSVEWGGLRRIRVHRVNVQQAQYTTNHQWNRVSSLQPSCPQAETLLLGHRGLHIGKEKG
ncbi:hypothetical protein AVEN_12713-1 [Araneus ventricosus]|uniref:Uncharacterized protein n=1 Tax=Araneus ventricosus TaxID=182803 RepID=A0A4Y2ACR5_ARAVE|nr:hypothetical protein AVEN_12713-1 [Araneus ventricosus]